MRTVARILLPCCLCLLVVCGLGMLPRSASAQSMLGTRSAIASLLPSDAPAFRAAAPETRVERPELTATEDEDEDGDSEDDYAAPQGLLPQACVLVAGDSGPPAVRAASLHLAWSEPPHAYASGRRYLFCRSLRL